MLIIGCDFHSRFQQIAMLDPTTGEIIERRLEHENGEAKMFYATLPSPARVGVEATCDAPWFERVLREHHHELWIGDAAEIRAAMVRKQKTDSRDALHILDLLLTNRFPRIWVPSLAERDLRQMLRHRHKLVRFRTSVMNQLHALAMGQGLCRRKKLWAQVGRKELQGLMLDPWASLRRGELLQLHDQFDPWIAKLDEAVMQAAESRPAAVCLMQQAGVGPTGDRISVCADHRAGESLCQQQKASELSGAEPQRRQLCWSATIGWHQQTRQPDDALLAGRGGPDGLPTRSGIAAGLSAIEVSPWRRGGEGSHRTKIGGAAVLEAAGSRAACAVSLHAG